MHTFEIHALLFGKDVTAQVLVLPPGIHVSLFGGDLPHIGAVSIAGTEGLIHTEQFPGHREGVVSSQWAAKLSEAGYAPAVAEAGIHYDRLDHEGIERVLKLAEDMLKQVLDELDRIG